MPGSAPRPKTAQSQSHRRFGANLARLRSELGYTQEGAAVEAGFPRAYWADVERGGRNVSLRNIVRICENLGIEPAELLEGVVKKPRRRRS